MKDCIRDAYEYYHHPLKEKCEQEFRGLPILFGRKKKEEALREKYKQKGIKVVRYEDFKYPTDELMREARGCLKPCADYLGSGHYICGIDGSSVDNCAQCRGTNDCRKLMDFLWNDLFD